MKTSTSIALVLGGLFLFSFKRKSNTSRLAIDAMKSAFGPLTNEQINSIEAIVLAYEKYGDQDGSKLAYILATAWHESNLKPIKEVRAASNTSLYSTQNKYWYTGYYGRGFVQLTWLYNYYKMSAFLGVDLVNNPDLALHPKYAAQILVYGMYNGSFTSKKLGDYINGNYNDFYNARRIVNGLDRANLINDYAISIVNYKQNIAA